MLISTPAHGASRAPLLRVLALPEAINAKNTVQHFTKGVPPGVGKFPLVWEWLLDSAHKHGHEDPVEGEYIRHFTVDFPGRAIAFTVPRHSHVCALTLWCLWQVQCFRPFCMLAVLTVPRWRCNS